MYVRHCYESIKKKCNETFAGLGFQAKVLAFAGQIHYSQWVTKLRKQDSLDKEKILQKKK